MKILGIETSCDETAIAVLEVSGAMQNPKFRALSNIVASQIAVHRKFGGIVPNLAKREHQKNLVPILITALKTANLIYPITVSIGRPIDTVMNLRLEKIFSHEPELLKHFLKKAPKIVPPKIDAIAVTIGPGLAPALWTGVNLAKALALIWEKPIIPVNHLEGHIYINAIRGQKITFPALALIVSGGHTELVLMKRHGNYKVVGETRDDAAGECFDKVARLLGLGYPGGPAVAALADRIKNYESGIQVRFPRPMMGSTDFDFSFSGLKTAVLYFLRDHKNLSMRTKSAIAKEFQEAVVEVLVAKTIRAAKEYKVKTLILGGGVAANKKLRRDLSAAATSNLPKTKLMLPEISETTDNALMIAAAAFFAGKKKSAGRAHLRADPGARLD